MDRVDERYCFEPDWVVATSEILAEVLEHRDTHFMHAIAALPQAEGLRAYKVIADLLEDAPVTQDIAELLQRLTGVCAAFWVSFDASYRQGLAAGKTVIGQDYP